MEHKSEKVQPSLGFGRVENIVGLSEVDTIWNPARPIATLGYLESETMARFGFE